MLKRAWRVVAGAEPREGVAAAKSAAHSDPLPEEFTQGAMMSARVLISAWGTVPLPAGVVARDWPVAMLTRLETVLKALAMPMELVALAPIWLVAGSMKPARA